MSAIDDLLDNARRFQASFARGGLAAAPARRVAVVTCMDARIDVEQLLGLAPGDAHVIRNAGGSVTDDVIRSLLVSQRMLGTNETMVVHHTGCGMLAFRDDDLKDEIQAETGIRPPFSLEAFADVEGDVRQSMARLQASPFVSHEHVRGFVYDTGSGELREVG